MTASISASVVFLPREKRTVPCAKRGGKPSAARTCDGSIEPEVHAEPVETQIPSISNRKMRLSPSTFSKEMLSVPGAQ